jgi:hypothetical protein
LDKSEKIGARYAGLSYQDFSNLPMIHKGLHSLQSGQVELANYQEVRIRHFHQVLDKYINADHGEGQ